MICVSIADKNVNNILEVIQKHELSEIRLDAGIFSTDEIRKIFSSGKSLLATMRPSKNLSEKDRLVFLQTAVESGAEFVDIEVESDDDFKNSIIETAKNHKCSVIISYHNFEKTPSAAELEEIIKWCGEKNPDIIKIACMANSTQDSARMLSLYDRSENIISIAMGKFGKISRVASVLLGAPFIYASIDKGSETADGQITEKELSQILSQIERA